MTPAAVIARCLELQAAATSRAELDYATGRTAGTVHTLFTIGQLTQDERAAHIAATHDAADARRAELADADTARPSDAGLGYRTGREVGRVLALYAAGLLTADECDALTCAVQDAEEVRRG